MRTLYSTVKENHTSAKKVHVRNVQCLSLRCRPHRGGWRWQLLIAQVPVGKSKAIPPLHGGLQLNQLQRKIITYLTIRDLGNVVLLHPHIFGIFLGNVHLQRFNSVSNIQLVSSLILAFNYSNMWGLQFLLSMEAHKK